MTPPSLPDVTTLRWWQTLYHRVLHRRIGYVGVYRERPAIRIDCSCGASWVVYQ